MREHHHHRNHYIFFFTVLVVFVWSLLLYFVSPAEIIDKIGVHNSYLIAFLLALFGGVSSITTVPYLAALATFAAGGLNIFILTLISVPALTVGDAIFFYLGMRGRKFLYYRPDMKKKIKKITRWVGTHPKWIVPFFVFVYSGFTPFPVDILAIALALVKHPFKSFLIPVFAGNIVYVFIIALAAAQGRSLLMFLG